VALVKTPAIVLQVYPYSDTSLILRYFTPDLGVVSVIAKGIRKSGGRGAGVPDVFSEGVATIDVKPTRELQTLREFALTRTRLMLGSDVIRFSGAAVLSELILKHGGEEPHAELFERLGRGLDRLTATETHDPLITVLAEAWRIVALLGYEPQLDQCVSCGAAIGDTEIARFDYVAGGIRCAKCALQNEGPSAPGQGKHAFARDRQALPARERSSAWGPRVGPQARHDLRSLVGGQVPHAVARRSGHVHLLAGFVRYHLSGGRSLRSLDFLLTQLKG